MYQVSAGGDECTRAEVEVDESIRAAVEGISVLGQM